MELSTIIPSTTIKAARVTVFSSMLNVYMMASDMAVQIGIPELATKAERIGKSINMTSMTTMMEVTRSRRKDHTESPTTFGWLVILVMVTLAGSSFSNSSNNWSTSAPNSTMLLPGLISMETRMADVPSFSI